ncbi:MAG TPA: DNA recombination protein RmuC [Actinomycetota bacterium]|nr:DNA recombination protein RmuC [Actinomycetota bacterium]
MSHPVITVNAMDVLVVGVAFAVGACAAAVALRAQRAGEPAAGVERAVARLEARLSSDSSLLVQRLEGIDTRIARSQSASTDLAQGIFEALGDVRRATAVVAEQAREFSSLQDLLRAPKARGGLGEAMLEELLRQVLPPRAFSTQHRFSTGAIVDAVVRAGGKLVCIDSKFPLANYRVLCDAPAGAERAAAERAFASDVARHVDAIATRYVLPDEGTFDFAVMYVPAEGVYAEVLRLAHAGRPLFERALESKVVPMSPLTLYGYLQTVLMGLNCLQIEANAGRILDYCGRLQGDVERFASEYDTLGVHLTNARNRHEEGSRRLARFRESLDRVADLEEPGGRREGGPSLEVVGDA